MENQIKDIPNKVSCEQSASKSIFFWTQGVQELSAQRIALTS